MYCFIEINIWFGTVTGGERMEGIAVLLRQECWAVAPCEPPTC